IQEEYISATSPFGDDAWSRPQFLAKYALVAEQCTYLTATFGVQPEIGSGSTAIERATTYYPGLLAYRQVGASAFVQAGFQYGFSDRGYNTPDTIDYGVSFGWFLYRAQQCERDRGGLTGVIPQVEFYGSNIIRGGNQNLVTDVSNTPIVGTENFRNVF